MSQTTFTFGDAEYEYEDILEWEKLDTSADGTLGKFKSPDGTLVVIVGLEYTTEEIQVGRNENDVYKVPVLDYNSMYIYRIHELNPDLW